MCNEGYERNDGACVNMKWEFDYTGNYQTFEAPYD
jgi:hypothetical protein